MVGYIPDDNNLMIEMKDIFRCYIMGLHICVLTVFTVGENTFDWEYILMRRCKIWVSKFSGM